MMTDDKNLDPDSASNYGSQWLDEVSFDASGLVCAIAQDGASGRVLMVAWMNREALAETVATGRAVYWSRSRRKLWRKGEESGNSQRVREIRLDCDADVIMLQVEQEGGVACHTGRQSCLFRILNDGQWETVDPVVKDPAEMYGPTKKQKADRHE